MSTTENAHDTGHYVIITYRDSGKITAVVKAIDKDGNELGLYFRAGEEICLSDHPAGDWYIHLNDGRLDVGPFLSKEAAIADARKSIEDEIFDGRLRTLSGHVNSISVNGAAAPATTE